MERLSVEVRARRQMGKGPARRIRKEGLIPAVLYGPHRQPLALALEPKDLRKMLASGGNVLLDLQVRDGNELQTKIAMVKACDLDPLTDRPRHVDLYEISLQEAIKVDVPLSFVGEPRGVSMGGTLSPLLWSLEVSCLPEQVPHEIVVDCSGLKIGEILYARDLSLPHGVRMLTDPSTAVVTVTGRATEGAAAVPVAEEAKA